MKNIPKIEIKADKEKDKELFNNFLNHPNFPQHRHMILKAFPELKTLLTEKEEEDVVEEFVNNFYKDHRETITNIIKKSREEIKKYGKDALELLAKTMDYGWEKPITYKAKPTILPFPLTKKMCSIFLYYLI
jgi:Mg2+/Co2+ transporter CorB